MAICHGWMSLFFTFLQVESQQEDLWVWRVLHPLQTLCSVCDFSPPLEVKHCIPPGLPSSTYNVIPLRCMPWWGF